MLMWGRPFIYPVEHFPECFCPFVLLGPLGDFKTDEITLCVEMFIDPSSSLYFISDSNEFGDIFGFWL